MPNLNLLLSPPHLQRLHDALACLGKFSEYVMLEASRSKLCLIALNSSKSAHGSIFLFGGKFFDKYLFTPTQGHSLLSTGAESKLTCRLLTKALLSVFRQRYLDSRDKETAIEKCELTLGNEPTGRGGCGLLVRLICKHGAMKLYKLNYEDADVMHAIFDKQSTYNHWKMNAKLLKEYLEHFGPKAEQLDISLEDGRVRFTSITEKLMDGAEVLRQPLHTAISLDIIEFEDFTVEEQLHITINLKDFKAIVSHADSMSATITAYYNEPGRPLQIQYDGGGISCVFTLMTVGGNIRPIHISPQQHASPAPSVSRQLSTAMASQTNNFRPNATPSQALREPHQLEDNEAATLEGDGQALESLFFPVPDDEEPEGDDRMNEDAEDGFLGWDVNMDSSVRTTASALPQLSLAENRFMKQRSRIMMHGINAQTEDLPYQDVEIIGPTQQISQARGLFD